VGEVKYAMTEGSSSEVAATLLLDQLGRERSEEESS